MTGLILLSPPCPRPNGRLASQASCAVPLFRGEPLADPSRGWLDVCLTFRMPPPPSVPFAGAYIALSLPPVPCAPFWVTPSCSLRAQRRHASWLSSALRWITVALRLAGLGRRCRLAVLFPAKSARDLYGWLLAYCHVQDGRPSLSLRFTTVHRLNSFLH